MTIYSLDVLLFLFGTSLLFHVLFCLVPDLHTGFSRGRSGGLVFPSVSEFSTVIVIHTVKGFGIVNKAEIDVFMEFSCFFHDPADVGNLSIWFTLNLHFEALSFVRKSLDPVVPAIISRITFNRAFSSRSLYILICNLE